jgi:hypothetical protein
MTHPETDIVSEKNGPRPAGAPDRCFYCSEPTGSPHKLDCVCRRRTVIIEYRIEMAIEVPESWTPDKIEFARGDGGSWCANNALDDIANFGEKQGCLCGHLRGIFMREATGDEDKVHGLENIEEAK